MAAVASGGREALVRAPVEVGGALPGRLSQRLPGLARSHCSPFLRAPHPRRSDLRALPAGRCPARTAPPTGRAPGPARLATCGRRPAPQLRGGARGSRLRLPAAGRPPPRLPRGTPSGTGSRSGAGCGTRSAAGAQRPASAPPPGGPRAAPSRPQLPAPRANFVAGLAGPPGPRTWRLGPYLLAPPAAARSPSAPASPRAPPPPPRAAPPGPPPAAALPRSSTASPRSPVRPAAAGAGRLGLAAGSPAARLDPRLTLGRPARAWPREEGTRAVRSRALGRRSRPRISPGAGASRGTDTGKRSPRPGAPLPAQPRRPGTGPLGSRAGLRPPVLMPPRGEGQWIPAGAGNAAPLPRQPMEYLWALFPPTCSRESGSCLPPGRAHTRV